MENLEKILATLNGDDNSDDIRKENFSRGLPIYYFANGHVIKEAPDGRKWVVDMDENRNEILVRALNNAEAA